MPQQPASQSGSAILDQGAPPPGIPLVTVQGTTTQQPLAPQSHHEASPCMNPSQRRSFLRLAISEDAYQEIPAPNITAMQFTPAPGMKGWYRSVSSQGRDAAKITELIDFENPQATDAKPGGVITGIFKATYSTSTGQQESRSFRLLGSSLLQDTAFPNIYYQASEELGRCIRN
ncbi:MAG: hypothetical protein ACK5N0_11195 [Synechococcaceae cyanobacterium]